MDFRPTPPIVPEPIGLSDWRLIFEPKRGLYHAIGVSDHSGRVQITAPITGFEREKLVIEVRCRQRYRLTGSSTRTRETDFLLHDFCIRRGVEFEHLFDHSDHIWNPYVDFDGPLASARRAPYVVLLTGAPSIGKTSAARWVGATYDCPIVAHREVWQRANRLIEAGYSEAQAISAARTDLVQTQLDQNMDESLVLTDIVLAGCPEDEEFVAAMGRLSKAWGAKLVVVTLVADEAVRRARRDTRGPAAFEIGGNMERFADMAPIDDTFYAQIDVHQVTIDNTHLSAQETALEFLRLFRELREDQER